MAATRDRRAFSAIALLLAICISAFPAEAKYGGGTGEPNDPYLIYTPEQLNAIGVDPNGSDKHFKLMADIDLSGYAERGFNVIGPNPSPTRSRELPRSGGSFAGVFDGDNHVISNLTWSSARQGPAGLFGYVAGPGAEVKNLVLTNPVMVLSQGSYGAPLVASLSGGTLTNCHVRGGRMSGADYVGGLVRFNSGTISNCSVEMAIEGYQWVGGLVGQNRGTIIECDTDASVTGHNQVGGLVGLNEESIIDSHAAGDVNGVDTVGGLVGSCRLGTIRGCSSAGNVTGREVVGGLVGSSQSEVLDCYSSGSVTGTRYVGGLIGIAAPYRVENCYATGDVQGTEYAGGLAGRVWGSLLNCLAGGDVTGDNWIGGLVGHNQGTITNCYATGSILGPDKSSGNVQVSAYPYGLAMCREPHGGPTLPAAIAGGLVGWNSGSILNSYSSGAVRARDAGGLVGICTSGRDVGSFWDVEASGQTASAGGVGKTTDQMKTLATFFGWGAFDSRGAWTVDDGNDYPRLSWENRPGRLIDWPCPAGEGTREVPYQICTAEELLLIGRFPAQWNKHFELTMDVDLSACDNAAFTIGDRKTPFTGVFEGNGHTISNFRYGTEDSSAAGLFGRVADPNAEIRNVGLIDPNVNASGGYNVGSLVGYLARGIVANCYAKGGTVLGRRCVGGLVGLNDQAEARWPPQAYAFLKECYCTSDVAGGSCVGGLVGSNISGLIANCYSAGAVAARDTAGGLIGENGGTITKCYSIGAVAGDVRVGGLVGENLDAYASVVASFWDVDVSGQPTSTAGLGLGTATMKTADTFLDAGWDFVDEAANGVEDIWWIVEGQDYPRLFWEFP